MHAAAQRTRHSPRLARERHRLFKRTILVCRTLSLLESGNLLEVSGGDSRARYEQKRCETLMPDRRRCSQDQEQRAETTATEEKVPPTTRRVAHKALCLRCLSCCRRPNGIPLRSFAQRPRNEGVRTQQEHQRRHDIEKKSSLVHFHQRDATG